MCRNGPYPYKRNGQPHTICLWQLVTDRTCVLIKRVEIYEQCVFFCSLVGSFVHSQWHTCFSRITCYGEFIGLLLKCFKHVACTNERGNNGNLSFADEIRMKSWLSNVDLFSWYNFNPCENISSSIRQTQANACVAFGCLHYISWRDR